MGTVAVERVVVRRGRWSAHLWYVPLALLAVILLGPVLWMVSTSLKEPGTEFAYPPVLVPQPIVWRNYLDALAQQPFGRYLANTLIIAGTATLGTVISASLAAFGFARIRFPGRDLLFVLLLSTMMLPDVVTLVPRYILFSKLHWINTFLPLTVPPWFGGGAFNVFLIRQFFMGIPYELDEAARMDGANNLQIYRQILLPLAGPALATVAIFTVVANWNDFLSPLIYLNTPDRFTLALGLQNYQTLYGVQWAWLMAAAMVMVAPVVALFFAFQRFFVQGIQVTGLAGR
jgi:multiple sugar transport system permease protein